MNLTGLRTKVDRLLAANAAAQDAVVKERRFLTSAKGDLEATIECQRVLQEVAQKVQRLAHVRISRVVSRCLESIFGDQAYEFKLAFDRKRGKTEARPVFVRDGNELTPRDVGGGVVDVTSFALRLASLILQRPKLRRLLVLDEPFRFLSAEYQPQVAEMIQGLAEEFGVQFIIVTHNQLMRTGNVINLENIK